jgi:hypothetical protein
MIQTLAESDQMEIKIEKVKFDVALYSPKMLKRAGIETLINMGRLKIACRDYITEQQEEEFKAQLFLKDREEYCRYLLAKIYSWAKYVHKVELSKLYAVFFGNETEFQLYRCHVLDIRISSIDFMEPLGMFPQETIESEEVLVKGDIFNPKLAIKKVSLQNVKKQMRVVIAKRRKQKKMLVM